MVTGLALGITASSHFVVAASAEVIRKKIGVTAVNNAQIDTAQSKFGGASAYFDGINDRLDAALGVDLGTDDFTIEGWFDADTKTNQYTRFFQYGNNAEVGSFYISSDQNSDPLKPGITLYNGSYVEVGYSATALSAGWNHIAAVRQSGNFYLYLNGTLVVSTTSYTSYSVNPNTKTFYLGTASNYSADYPGHIDEVRVSNTARYTTGFTPSTTPFVNDENTLLLLHMDGTDGSSVFEDDNGVRAKKGVVAVGNAQIDTAQSKFGGASALFDGNDKLTVSPMTPVTGDFTIEFWVRFNTAPGAYSNTNWQMAWTKNSNTYFLLWSNYIQVAVDGKYGAFNLGSTMTTGNWYHLALVRTSSDYKVYFNGTDTGSATDNGNWSTRNGSFDFFGSGSNLIGDYTTSKGINGWLDEVRISNTARYTANFTSPTAPFVNDANTLLLLHMDGTDTSTDFRDDNGVRSKVGITAIGNAQIDTAQSKFGGSSAIIASVGDYMNIGNPKQFDFTSDYTVECWINLASKSSGTKEIITIKDAGTLRGVLQFGSNNNYGFNWYIPGFRVFDGNTGGIGYAETNTGQWYHLAFTRSGNAFAFFINGTICESAAGTPTQTHDSVTIGSAAGSGYISPDYHIDEVRISNTARYTSGFTPSTTPFQNDSNTLLLLHMDGTDGSTTFIDDNGVPPDYDYGA